MYYSWWISHLYLLLFFLENTAPPSPPQNLVATTISSKSVTIEWEKPLSDGGSELLGYVVEKRLSTLSSTIKWSRVVTLDTYCLRYCIDNLKEKSEYVFRVLAENAIGLSAPAETENIVLKTHASKCDLDFVCSISVSSEDSD